MEAIKKSSGKKKCCEYFGCVLSVAQKSDTVFFYQPIHKIDGAIDLIDFNMKRERTSLLYA